MKKTNVIRDAVLGGCLGIILFEISRYIYKIITQGFNQEIIQNILENVGIFLIFAFWFGLFSIIFHKKFDQSKQLSNEKREKILKKSQYYIIIAGFITIILGIISLLLKAPTEISILIFANSFALLIWLIGIHIGYINLKKHKKNVGVIFMNYEKETNNNHKSIVIYFSRADENYVDGKMKYIEKGNTEIVAEYIRDITGADLFKVERKIPYSAEYKTCLEESRQENNTGAKPELANYLDNIDDYKVIYIGGPVYLGLLPAPMVTQLEKLNFEDKIVRPFTTHEGSGLGLVPNQLRKICVGAKMEYGIAIKGSEVESSKEKLEKWINT